MSFSAPYRAKRRRADRTGRLLRGTLLTTAVLDELTFGFLVVALPLLRDQVGMSYDQIGLLFTVGALSSLVFDPVINLLSDRGSKHLPILAGMLALVACFLLAGVADSYALLLLAFAAIWPANGAAVELAQAALIDAQPADGARTMARWTLLSGVGDLLAPLTVSLFAALRLGWTALCALAAAVWLAAALVTWPQRFPAAAADASDASGDDDQPRPSIVAALRDALRDPLLVRWSVVVLLASMLDEVFLGFAALYLHDHLHVTAGITSLALLANLAGSMVGLVILDRALGRIRGERLLPWYALLALVGSAGFLLAPGPPLALAALFLTGLGASGWYPIAQAAAYATHPGRSGTVRAVISLGTPFETALPGIVGLLSGRFGLAAGIGFLGLAPLAVLVARPRGNHSSGVAP